MIRKIKSIAYSDEKKDNFSNKYIQILGLKTANEFNPIISLNIYQEINSLNQFLHPHRGMVELSYFLKGTTTYKDNLGYEQIVDDNSLAIINTASGVIHEKNVRSENKIKGIELWLNLEKKYKMKEPFFKIIAESDFKKIALKEGIIKVLFSNFEDDNKLETFNSPFFLYEITCFPLATIKVDTQINEKVILIVLDGTILLDNNIILANTAVLLDSGNLVTFKNMTLQHAIVFLIKCKDLDESLEFRTSIVMNEKEEIITAYTELENGNFIKYHTKY